MAELKKPNSFRQGPNGEVIREQIGNPVQRQQGGAGATPGSNTPDASGTGASSQQFSDTGVVGNPLPALANKAASFIKGIRAGLANAEATSEQGGQRPPITPYSSDNPPSFKISLADQSSTPTLPDRATVVPTSVFPSGAELQREALGGGATVTGKIVPISPEERSSAFSNEPIKQVISPDSTGVLFDNKQGGLGYIVSNKTFSPDQLERLGKTIETNALQSTKDRFARDAANTEEQNRRYGTGTVEPGSKEFLQQRLAEEFKRPFLRRGVIGDLEGALKGIDTDKTNRDTLASSLVTNQTQAQQKASQQAFENENKNIQIQQTATKNLFELKDKGASPIELFNRYKADTGNKPIGLGALSNIAPPDKFNAALGDPGKLKALLQEIGIPERDQISLLSEQRQQLGQ